MSKTIILLLSLSLNISALCQSKNESTDSCFLLYAKAGDLSYRFNIDTLNIAVEIFDSVINGSCQSDVKNLYRYHKARTLHQLGYSRKALRLLRKSNYPDIDDLFLSFLYQEKYFIHLDLNRKKKALSDINKALSLTSGDEFTYRKSIVLFELSKYSDVIHELSKITYHDPLIVSIHELTSLSAFKSEQFKLSIESCNYILENKEKYNEETIHSAELILLLIKRKKIVLNENEFDQLNVLKEKVLNREILKEI